MKWNFKPVDDHEEWLKIVERAEGGVVKVQGFRAYNSQAPRSSPRRLITEENVVARAAEEIKKRHGWGVLAGWSQPMGTVGDDGIPNVVAGGWWIHVPVNYLDFADDPDRLEFYVRAYGRDITLWAWEAHELREGVDLSIPEFGQMSEAALVNGNYYMYDESPHAPDLAEKMFGPPRESPE